MVLVLKVWNQKTEPNQTKINNRVKVEKNQAKPDKIEPNQKNQVKPKKPESIGLVFGFCSKITEPVGLNQFQFFKKKINLIIF